MPRDLKKLHHYVPRSFLAQFTDTGQADGRLFIVHKASLTPCPSTPGQSGGEKFFYRCREVGLRPDAVEDYLTPVDAAGVTVIRQIVAAAALPEDENGMTVLFHYMARLVLGGVKVRNMLAQWMPFIYQTVRENINEGNYRAFKAMWEQKRPELPESYSEFLPWWEENVGTSDTSQNIFCRMLVANMEFGLVAFSFSRFHWSLIHTEEGRHFISADCPIARLPTAGSWLPISPKFGLLGSRDYSEPAYVADCDTVAELNGFVADGAERFLYSSTADIHLPDGSAPAVAGSDADER